MSREALQEAVNKFCDHHFGVADEALAMDDKTRCGSVSEDGRQVQMINVVGHQSKRCFSKKVGKLPVAHRDEQKQTNESKVFAPALNEIDIADLMVTSAAKQTQKDNAQYLVE